MKIVIISVGKNHDPKLAQAISEYESRLAKYVGPVSWELIPSTEIGSESKTILKRQTGVAILLDETGELITTPKLADKIERYQNQSTKQLTFIIGGAYGVNESVKSNADFVWSLSPLVFPHQLVRLMLVEQLYRSYDLLAGGKYHHS